MNDTRMTRARHARAAMAARNARGVGGLAVAWVVTGRAVPLDGDRPEVVVGRLEGQPGDRHKLQEKRCSGGLPDPERVGHPQHSCKGSAGA